jgi:hypothetical protein
LFGREIPVGMNPGACPHRTSASGWQVG